MLDSHSQIVISKDSILFSVVINVEIDPTLDIVSEPATLDVASEVSQIEPQMLKDFTKKIPIFYFDESFQTDFAAPTKECNGNLRYSNCMTIETSKNLSLL